MRRFCHLQGKVQGGGKSWFHVITERTVVHPFCGGALGGDGLNLDDWATSNVLSCLGEGGGMMAAPVVSGRGGESFNALYELR